MPDPAPETTATHADAEAFSGKVELKRFRERARRLFLNGATGAQVASAVSDITDALLLELTEKSLESCEPEVRNRLPERGAIVAVGGTGRGELSPYSDVDLLFLHDERSREDFHGFAAMVVRECWDAGMKLGHSVRTLPETLALAQEDVSVATALVEARLLWGSERLFQSLKHRFRNRVTARLRTFVDRCIAAREEERRKFGGTVRQLAPDVKGSPGGLRDVHLLRWIGFARFGSPQIDSIRLAGGLLRPDARDLLNAYDFLLRVRHDLHFHAGRAEDLLSRDDQLRITRERGIEDVEGQRGVERFMQEYFLHTGRIDDVVRRFVALQRPRSPVTGFVEWLFRHRVDGVFGVGPTYVTVVSRHRERVCSDLDSVMELYRLAALSGVLPSPLVEETITRAKLEPPPALTDRAARAFLEILRCTSQLGPILRSMYATGVLDCIVPDFTRTRGLLQFNQYHHFTVDEHTLRCVEAATSFEDDFGPLGNCYDGIRHKQLLHLALLLHDLGKGFPEDHSDVGRAIAERIGRRLHLPDHQREVVVFLVWKHLAMTHLAFRRDITDPAVVVEFAQLVASPETLRMLYCLSVADLHGVGPGTWTEWKGDLLRELHEQTSLHLSGMRTPADEEHRLAAVRDRVLADLGDEADDTLRHVLDGIPPHYLLSLSTKVIANDLRVVGSLGEDEIAAHGVYEPESDTVEYRIVARRISVTGFFQRITGTLAANGCNVLAAWIATTRDGVVIDRFDVSDRHHDGRVPEWRTTEICDEIKQVLSHESVSVRAMHTRSERFLTTGPRGPRSNQATKVSVDNETSERCTVVDVFAHDRPGLLYVIARTLYEHDLSIDLAKISTHLDQVVDVFYVTDRSGEKVRDGARLVAIRSALKEAIEALERHGLAHFAR